MMQACLLTVAVETLFFAATRYRREPHFLVLCAAVNVATNLSLNLLMQLGSWPPPWWLVLLAEGAVVLGEYALYAIPYRPSRRLLLYTFLANALSFSIGLVLFPW